MWGWLQYKAFDWGKRGYARTYKYIESMKKSYWCCWLAMLPMQYGCLLLLSYYLNF